MSVPVGGRRVGERGLLRPLRGCLAVMVLRGWLRVNGWASFILQRSEYEFLVRMGMDSTADPPPPCAVPVDPALASATWTGSPIQITFLSHTPFPLRLYYVGEAREEVHLGSLDVDGHALTFESSDNHAWVVRTWGGVTVMEVEPLEGRAAQTTINIYDCDLSSAARRLHNGWK